MSGNHDALGKNIHDDEAPKPEVDLGKANTVVSSLKETLGAVCRRIGKLIGVHDDSPPPIEPSNAQSDTAPDKCLPFDKYEFGVLSGELNDKGDAL